jgi:anaerobic selenocysteine-containing dehydrogenase
VLNDPDLDPPIDALVVHNSNPAVIVPGQNRVVAGLEREDLFTVVIDQFLTDTARYADIVLPTTTQLEQLDLGTSWGHLDLSLNRPAIAPVGLSKPNTEIFRLLAQRLNLDDERIQLSDEAVIREMLDSDHPWLDGITYETLEANDWIRLRVPDADQRLYVDIPADTPDGKLRLGTLTVDEGVESPTATPELAARYPLQMMSRRRQTAFLNANYGGFPEHQDVDSPRLQMHPVDAQARNLSDGDHATVFNDRGRLTLTVEVTDSTRPGLVAVPWGWWHRAAPEDRGVNALTNPAMPADGVGSAFFQENLVEVERAQA